MIERGEVIANSGLRLRSSPRDGAVRAVLRNGTVVDVLSRETWLRVRLAEEPEVVGFVLADYVDPHTAAPGPAAPGAGLATYVHPRFRGEAPRIHPDFTNRLDRIAGFAEATDVYIFVTGALREPYVPVHGAVVEPARMSNHHVGHAIDLNVIHNNEWFNSTRLRHPELLSDAVHDFIGLIRADRDLRWGGDFTTVDPVHVDDDLNHRDPAVYTSKLRALWGV